MARLRMFAGPNGSGKSSLYSRLVAEGHFSPTTFLNADEIQATLDRGAKYWAPVGKDAFWGVLNRSSFLGQELSKEELSLLLGSPQDGLYLASGRCAPYLAAAIADALRVASIAEGTTFAFETVMSHESKLDLLRESRKTGYRNYLYFVSTDDPNINVERVRQRVREGGHPVPDHKVVERYFRCMALLPQALRLCDRAYLFDNSGSVSRLVAHTEGGVNLHLETNRIPRWVQSLIPVSEE